MRLLRLRPSMREKKRYVAFQVVGRAHFAYGDVSHAILDSFRGLAGDLGVAMAGPIVVREAFDEKKQGGIVRVGHKWVTHLRASFAMINRVGSQKAMLHARGTSGMLTKAKEYIAG